MSTHDLSEARQIGGEMVLLHRGRVIESANAVEFLIPQNRRSQVNCWSKPRRIFGFIRSAIVYPRNRHGYGNPPADVCATLE
jgi:hypothetical protein